MIRHGCWLDYQYTETHGAVATDNGDKQIDVHAVGGKVYLNSHGERTLDHDDLVTLRKKLDEVGADPMQIATVHSVGYRWTGPETARS